MYCHPSQARKWAGFDESLNQGYDETDEEYGQRLEVREAIREQGVK